jgi:hypothetical protein
MQYLSVFCWGGLGEIVRPLSVNNYTFFLNIWWHDATLFVYFSYFYNIHLYNHIHPSPFAEASLHFLIACMLSGKDLPEPGIELGPALQQADALPTEPRRTIINNN